MQEWMIGIIRFIQTFSNPFLDGFFQLVTMMVFAVPMLAGLYFFPTETYYKVAGTIVGFCADISLSLGISATR